MGFRSRRVSSIAFAALILAASVFPLLLYIPAARAMTLYNSGNPTPDEQLVLEYINRARANPIAEGQRLGIDIHEGLSDPSFVGPRPPLAMNPLLLGIAETHSSDMYNQNYFSHNDLNGNTPFDRMTNAGYNYARAGEDMAAGSDMSASDLEDFMMVDSGTQGRPHRVNLLDIFPYPCDSQPCIYSEVGVGYYAASTPNSIGNSFITVDFGATLSTSPFLLGVVYNDRNGNSFYDIGEGIAGATITPSTGSYYAVSSSSGGYAIPISTSGTITVTASIPGFGSVTKTVTLTGTNIKLDFTATTAESQSITQSASQSTTQTTLQTTTQTSASFQSVTQSSQTSTQPMLQSVIFQSTPSSFGISTNPATITACGNTFANGQSTTGCGTSFTATANLPSPSTGWQFNHWMWNGGVSCSSDSTNPVTCSAYDSGSVTAVYEAQVQFVTNPASSALISWGSCSNSELGNGASFYSTSFGMARVNPCYVPPGYTLLGWTCTGGLTCSGSNGPATVTFSGPGTITMNLQEQTITTTTPSLTSSTSTTASPPLIIIPNVGNSTTTITTMATAEFQTTQSIMLTLMLGALALVILRRRTRRKK